MNPDEAPHIGDGHEDTPYVGLIRGISNEVHEHEIRMAKSNSFDEGYLAGIDAGVRMVRAETRAIRRRHIDRLSATYRHWRRSFLEEFLCCGLIVVSPLLAIWLLKGG